MRTMLIKDETLLAVAKAIRQGIRASLDDRDLAEAALQAFADTASLSDWDRLEDEKQS